MIQRKYSIILGRNEPIIFPDNNPDLQFPAKVDTGAYHSSIHCSNVSVKKAADGTQYLSGDLLAGHPCSFGNSFHFETTNYRKVIVANSFGAREERYEVSFRCKIGPLVFTTPFTLSNRSKKLFPILLGRKALSRRFLVDTAKSNIDRMELKANYGNSIPFDDEDLIEE